MPAPPTREFADVLADFRERHHLTQQALADNLDVDNVTVSRWELGLRTRLPERLLALALDGLEIELAGRDFRVPPPEGQEWRVYALACPDHGTVATWAQPQGAVVAPPDAATATWLRHRLDGCAREDPDILARTLPTEVDAPARHMV